MKYRKITKEEEKAFANLSATAFHDNAEDSYKDIEKGKFNSDTIRVLSDEEDKFTAGLRLFEFEMWLDTGYVKSGGIGDVSSYPEHRRGGKISKLMNSVLREMYDNDYVISYLYPFSHPFYRKYGYELCREKQIVTLQTEHISYKNDDSYAKQHVPKDNDLSDDIEKIYKSHAKHMNFMVKRYGWLWDRILDEDAYTSKNRTYVCYLSDGTPCAYFHYEYENVKGSHYHAKIYDMAYINRDAFDILLRFVYRLAPAIKEISFACSPKVMIFDAVEKSWKVKMETRPGGMMRIVNVEKTFDAINVPQIDEYVNIKITDDNLKENNGVFTISISGGKAAAERNDGAQVHLECSIHALSQLVSGFRVLDEIKHREDIIIHSKKEILDMIFIKKPIHIQDFF